MNPGNRTSRRQRGVDQLSADVAAIVNHIRRLERGLRLIARQIEAGTGASAAQLFILEQLATADALSLQEVAQRTFTDRSSVSEVIDRLVVDGLAVRRVSRADRRRAEVRITPAGQRALVAAPTTPAQRLIDAVQSLPLRSRRELKNALGRVNGALGLDRERPHLLFEDAPRERRLRSRRRALGT